MSTKQKQDFCLQIREQALLDFQKGVISIKTPDMTLLEAITEHCNKINIDVEDAPSLLSPRLLRDLMEESKARNLIKR